MSSSALTILNEPTLAKATLLLALTGWMDGGSVSTGTVKQLMGMGRRTARQVARIEPDEFYIYNFPGDMETASIFRPHVKYDAGLVTDFDMPGNTFWADERANLAFFIGKEPNLRWRTFADSIVSAAEQLGVEMVVSLGALMADVAHTRPVPITGLASDPDLVEQLGMSRSSYEGPTGIVGVVHDACRRHGMTSASLWAAVPHYVAAVPNPKAALALLRRLEGLTGIAVEASELEDAAERFTEQVDQAVSANPEIEELVANLEASQEEDYEVSTQDMPSADDLAQDFQRFLSVDVSMPADSEATLPALIEAVKAAIPNDRKAAIEKRGEAAKKNKTEAHARTLEAAALAWDASPISTARLVMETWGQIKNEDWSLVAQSGNVSNWPHRLWPMEKHYHWLGQSGGYGVGYGAPAAVGAALANRDLGRFSVSIQGDGDLMYAPGVLWTAAKHKIPLLSVMHNNRGYHQELMHVQRLSSFRNRVASLGGDIGPIGTSIMNPDIEYHKLAESMGWWAKGPITDPEKLGPAIKEAVAVVKSGQPALLNVWTQPR